MRKIYEGFNSYHEGYDLYVEFNMGPKWLKILASTWFLDRFAYQSALTKGLGFAHPLSSRSKGSEVLKDLGWKVLEEPIEWKFFRGSLADLRPIAEFQKKSRYSKWREANLADHPSIKQFFTRVNWEVLIPRTRWSRVRSGRKRIHHLNGTYNEYLSSGF